MEAKHTPPPWVIDGFADCQLITKDVPVAIGQPIGIAKVYSPNHIADARLIAAAPDLLAALEAALAVHGDGYSWGEQARAAIAKATGQ